MVNVLLVDFRGFDTLLEIMVLGVASLAIYAMVNLNLEARDLGARLTFPKKKKQQEPLNRRKGTKKNTAKLANTGVTNTSGPKLGIPFRCKAMTCY